MKHAGIASSVAAMALMATVLLGSATAANADDGDVLRGDRVGWARLKTHDPDNIWRRHASGDPTLMQFIREQTTLNIDPTWYVADIGNLQEMCRYPLLFSQGLHYVTDERQRANVAEYIRRGGFLIIDVCINADLNPDCDERLASNIAVLTQALPEAKVVKIPPTHDIYHCFFEIPDGVPPHTYFNNVYNPKLAKHGLYALMIGSRMAGVISLCGLQCGWDRMIAPPGHDVACMKMLVNIYVYAMTQGGK